jgi:hypothetical protein
VENTSLDYFLIAAFDNELRNRVNLNHFSDDFLKKFSIEPQLTISIVNEYFQTRIKEMKENTN